MPNMRNLLQGFVLLFISFAVLGCTNPELHNTNSQVDPIVEPSLNLQTPIIAERSGTPELSSDSLPTQTPSPSRTPTMFPTLTSREAMDVVANLWETNGGCQLPCWWGVSPGISTWEEVDNILKYLGGKTISIAKNDGFFYHAAGGFDLDLADSVITNRFGFLENDNVIELILIRSDGFSNPSKFQEQWKNFSPKNVMEDYGSPTRILIKSHSSGPVTEDRIASYDLFIIYDHLGFLIIYSGYSDYEQTFHFCPRFDRGKDIRQIELYLQSPENQVPVEINAAIIGLEVGVYPDVRPIEDAAGITAAELYQLFISENMPACFDTAKDIWP